MKVSLDGELTCQIFNEVTVPWIMSHDKYEYTFYHLIMLAMIKGIKGINLFIY